MIPYVEQPVLVIGSLRIHAFGVLVATAIVVGVAITRRRAAGHGLDAERAFSLASWTVISGLVGSHLFSELAYFPEGVRANPLVLLNLAGSMSAFGGILGGLAGGLVVARWQGLSPSDVTRFVDALAYAFPFAWLLGRSACALAHDHPGIHSTLWFAVRYPDGPRLDLGLLELAYTVPIALAFFFLGRRPRPAGFFVGLFFVLYGPFRLLADSLREGDALYFGFTPSQYVSLVVLVGGMVILGNAHRRGKLGATQAANR